MLSQDYCTVLYFGKKNLDLFYGQALLIGISVRQLKKRYSDIDFSTFSVLFSVHQALVTVCQEQWQPQIITDVNAATN